MKFVDFSPARSPSLDQQRDALQKGLGRAVQWAETGCLDNEPLLNACLTDQRYDIQVEDSRTEWLWRVIETVNAKDRLRVPILHALYGLADQRSAYQLCELAFHYAQTGDDAFRTRLYEIVEMKPIADCSMLAELEIVRLDKGKGFSFVARVRGKLLANREWDWDDGASVDEAIELLGESEVRSRLNETDDEATRRFLDRWNQETKRNTGRKRASSHKERIRAITISDILAGASNEKTPPISFRGWGMHATDSELEVVLENLWASNDTKQTARLLRVFSNRAMPTFDSRLIQLCQHNDKDIRLWAFNALEKNSDPAIRQFALDQLNDEEGNAIGLFTNNYEQGDEHTILDAIELPTDDFELHSILFDVIKVLENNADADSSQLGVIAFASTPCETCRFYAARLLHKQQVAPDWLIEECRLDSVEDCRTLNAPTDSTSNESD